MKWERSGFQWVGSFEDLDELFEEMAQDEEAANARVLPRQREIDWGSYVFRAVENGAGQALAIWGHVWTLEEFLEREKKAGAEPDELGYVEFRAKELHARGYRYGEYYSIVAERPDIGSAHIASLWPISRRDFEYARRLRWEIWPDFLERMKVEVRTDKQRANRTMEGEE